jgi:hypothetical protein
MKNDRITIRVSNPLEMAELDRRSAAVSLQIGPYMREVALGRIPAGPPDAEVMRLTRVLRDRLDRIDDDIADSHDLMSQIETALGLVAADGSRIDDATAGENETIK